MTIASQTSRISYTGDGVTTAFSVPFYFAANADLVVYVATTAGVQTLQVLGTNYNLTGATVSSGGTCTFVTAPTTGYTVTIYRDPAVTQTTSYNNNDPFAAKSHELALDKLTTIDQRTRDLMTRSIHLSESEATITTELTTPALRKNKLLGFDSTGALTYAVGPTFVGVTATGVAEVDTRSTAQVTAFAVSVNVVVTQGRTVAGDGGGRAYIRGIVSSPDAFLDGGGTQYWGLASIAGNVMALDTRATAAALRFPANINALVTYGLATAGDGGGSTYIRGTVASVGAFADASGQYWGVFATTSGGGNSLPGGRLTLTSATPVMGTSVAGATTVYYALAIGNQIPIYDGTNFISTTFAELSQATTDATKSPAAVTTSSNYDCFVWNDSSTVRCTRGPAWTSSTARGTGAGTTELELLNGIYVNKIAITNGPAARRGTYVGSIRSNASSTIDYIYGAQGTAAVLGVWNNYNRVQVSTSVSDATASWAYTSATIRQSRASAVNQVSFLSGLSEESLDVSVQQSVGFAAVVGASASIGPALDSTTVQDKFLNGNNNSGAQPITTSLTCRHTYPPQLGYHFVSMNEAGDGTNASTFVGQSRHNLVVTTCM